MLFFFLAIAGMYVGRRLGWALSKNVLYDAQVVLAIIVCTLWGALVAFALYALIQWQHPGLILKIVMGYALGSYVAIPNYGLISEAAIPNEALPRHKLISWVPLISFILLSVASAFLYD